MSDPMTDDPAQNPPSLTVQDFSHLVRLIHEGVLDTQALRRFLELFTVQLRGNSGILILRSSRLGEPPMSVVHGYVPRADSSYFNYYMAIDPFVQLPEGRAVTMHDFVDAEELERSEYFREYLMPLDMVYALGVDLRDKDRYHVRLRICRPRREGNFTASDCSYVETFIPHLRTGIRLFTELDQIRSERGFYAEAMDQLTLATIVLDETCRILHANEEPPMSCEVIQKLFGLTPKEATLALRLAAGESLLDAARTLNMSPNTARTHLRSVFAKTGVDRQASLVRVLLKSVAMLGQ